MKRFTLIILAFFLILINSFAEAAQSYTTKDLSVLAKDGFNIKATLKFPNDKTKKEFATVVLLHSFGYNSQWWGDMPAKYLNDGYAVLTIDLRGHGESVYNKKLVKVSWKSMTNNAFKKYPDDVVSVINSIIEDNPRKSFFDNYAIVGSDIGASAGIIAADKLKYKPKTIVMISPVVQSRGLYVPVSIAQLGGVDFLSISSVNDTHSLEAEKYLKKFAQNEFVSYTSSSKYSGMVMLKNDPEITKFIDEWLAQYLKEPVAVETQE